MIKTITLILGLIVSTILVGCSDTNTNQNTNTSENNQLTQEEKIQDFEQMFKTIEEGYPYLGVNQRMNNVDFVQNKSKYLEQIKNTENDEEFVDEMSQIVRELNNGHTHVLSSKEEYEIFKLYISAGWYDFLEEDKVVNRYDSIGYKTGTPSENIISKQDMILKDVIDKEVGYIHLPQMYGGFIGMTTVDIEKEIKLIDEYVSTLDNHKSLIIDIRGNGGGSDMYWINILSKIVQEDVSNTGYILFRSEDSTIKNYIDKRGITVESIDNLPEEVFENAPEEVKTDFDKMMKSTTRITSTRKSSFSGKIYLLVDKAVYSSAEALAIFSKESGFATLIGEKTAGDGGGIDPILFDLENSGLIIRMASDMYLTGSGVCNEEHKTVPHYEVKNVSRTENFEDDECIQKVLELENIDR